MHPSPPAGYDERAPTLDDIEAVAAMIRSCQVSRGAEADMSADELRSDWQGLNLAEEVVIVTTRDGAVVGSADVLNRRFMRVSIYAYVHPQHRGRGVGSFLVRWGEQWLLDRMDQAPPNARIVIDQYIDERDAPARTLIEAHGYTPIRTVYKMEILLKEPPPAPDAIEGVKLRPFVPDQDERATFETIEDGFRDMWNRPPGDFDQWMTLTVDDRKDPGLWMLAEDIATGDIVGTCLGKQVGPNGWISGVAVRGAWRQRGLGLALLRATFGEYWRRGVGNVQLSVDADSKSGAPRLYGRAGMVVVESYTLYQKELRAGETLAAAE
jgi:mycothiol synthase